MTAKRKAPRAAQLRGMLGRVIFYIGHRDGCALGQHIKAGLMSAAPDCTCGAVTLLDDLDAMLSPLPSRPEKRMGRR